MTEQDKESHPTNLTYAWENQTLTVENMIPKIQEYANDKKIPITHSEAESIARQIHRAYKKYHNPTEYAGEFMLEFAGDSIRRVFSAADNMNQRVLAVYHRYFYNCVPGDWRDKLR